MQTSDKLAKNDEDLLFLGNITPLTNNSQANEIPPVTKITKIKEKYVNLIRGVSNSSDSITGDNGILFFHNEIQKILRTLRTFKKGLHSAYTEPLVPGYLSFSKNPKEKGHETDKSGELSNLDGSPNRSARLYGAIPYHNAGWILRVNIKRIIQASEYDLGSGYGSKKEELKKMDQKEVKQIIDNLLKKIKYNNSDLCGVGEIIVDKLIPDDISGIYFSYDAPKTYDGDIFKTNCNQREVNQIIAAACMYEIYEKYTGKELPIIEYDGCFDDVYTKQEVNDIIIKEYQDNNLSHYDTSQIMLYGGKIEYAKSNYGEVSKVEGVKPLERDIMLAHSDVLVAKILSLYDQYGKDDEKMPIKIRYAVEVSNIKAINERYHEQLKDSERRGLMWYPKKTTNPETHAAIADIKIRDNKNERRHNSDGLSMWVYFIYQINPTKFLGLSAILILLF